MIKASLILGIALPWMLLLADSRHLGRIYAALLIGGILFCVLLYQLLKISKLNFDKSYIKYFAAFSIPLIPHALGGTILTFFDRIIINQL